MNLYFNPAALKQLLDLDNPDAVKEMLPHIHDIQVVSNIGGPARHLTHEEKEQLRRVAESNPS